MAAVDEEGKNALHIACSGAPLPVVEALLEVAPVRYCHSPPCHFLRYTPLLPSLLSPLSSPLSPTLSLTLSSLPAVLLSLLSSPLTSLPALLTFLYHLLFISFPSLCLSLPSLLLSLPSLRGPALFHFLLLFFSVVQMRTSSRALPLHFFAMRAGNPTPAEVLTLLDRPPCPPSPFTFPVQSSLLSRSLSILFIYLLALTGCSV